MLKLSHGVALSHAVTCQATNIPISSGFAVWWWGCMVWFLVHLFSGFIQMVREGVDYVELALREPAGGHFIISNSTLLFSALPFAVVLGFKGIYSP